MTLYVNDRWEAQALDINQALRRYDATGLITGGEVIPGSSPLTIDVGATTVYLGGERVQLSDDTLDISGLVDDDNPRKCVVYVDEEASYQIAEGRPEAYRPPDEIRFRTYRPAPPDLATITAIELAEVVIGANDERTTAADIRSRRLESRVDLWEGVIRRLKVDRLTDGAGTVHEGELADASDIPTATDFLQAVADDPNHGDRNGQVSHQYRTDTEIETVARALDASDLSAAKGQDAQLLGAVGDDAVWIDPPQTQVEVIDSGTLTATGGTAPNPAYEGRIEEVAASQGVMPRFLYSLGSESFAADYGLSATATPHWDEVAGRLDLDVTLTWQTDPGTGNDVTISYAVYNGEPEVVSGRYTDGDAVNAMTGASIAPASVLASTQVKVPVLADLSQYPNPTTGMLVVATGAGPYQAGEWVYYDDGSGSGPDWHGPNQRGVTDFSQLDVTANKDMSGYTFVNLGAPTNAGDALRLTDLTTHTGESGAHHTKTTTLAELNDTPQDVRTISSPANDDLAFHDGSGDLPRGVARFDASLGGSGAWWVDGCLGEWRGQVTLTNGAAVIDTGVTSQTAAFLPALGTQDPDQDVKVSATADWDDSAGTQKITIVENTSVGSPTINYTIRRWRY